jgi:hypothetical protein
MDHDSDYWLSFKGRAEKLKNARRSMSVEPSAAELADHITRLSITLEALLLAMADLVNQEKR